MSCIKLGVKVLCVICVLGIVSCNEPRIIEMEEVHKYEDGIPAIIPSAASVQTRIEKNVDLRLIVGDPKFYDASPDDMKKAAISAGQLALVTFGTDIEKGVLILTKDLKNHPQNPADGVVTDMKIDSLKAAMKGK